MVSVSRLVLSAAVLSAGALLSGAGMGPGRPLSDFLSTQGSTQTQIATVPDYLSWTDVAHGMLYSMDYTGLANAWTMDHSGGAVSYGTTISGSISEHALADGRADVQVVLHIHHALTYVVAYDGVSGPDFGDVRFGALPPEALASGHAAIGDAEMQVRFINTAPGAPLPDLFDAFVSGNALPGQELLFIRFDGNADGLLHAASGFPEGTAGRATVVQTGIFMSGFHGAVGDGFPAERIRLRAGH
jgi:hypothetical protein